MQVRVTDNNERLLRLLRMKYKEKELSNNALVNQVLGTALYLLMPEVKDKDDKQFFKSFKPLPMFVGTVTTAPWMKQKDFDK